MVYNVKRIKNIVDNGIYWGYAKSNVISQIAYEIATKEELEILSICWEIEDLTNRATKLYEQYREEYYKA